MNPSRLQQLPLWRDANRLLLTVEEAVRGFPRYHKYAIGTDLRRQAMGVVRLIIRAVNAMGAERQRQVRRLVLAIDDLKVLIQTAKELRAFANFRQFQTAAELAVAIGRQGGAWLRRLPA